MINEQRIISTFKELVTIGSESQKEGSFHELLKNKFQQLGLEIYEDQTRGDNELGGNNLICTLPSTLPTASPLFFSCHTDTVSPGENIKPQIRDNIIYSDGTTVLGADDKAGIAIMLELIEVLLETKTPHGTLEFILTTREEIGLLGAQALNLKNVTSKSGFVLDSAGPVGSIIVASPYLYSLEINIKGQAAHAGLEPELGISAIEIASKAIATMKLGRIDQETTANIGTIKGGTGANIVAPTVEILGEARSISLAKCQEQIKHMFDTFQETALAFGGEFTGESTLKSTGYVLTPENKTVALATKALESLNIKPNYQNSGGASDANVFNAQGKEALALSIGYEKIHTVDEYIPIKELVKSVELAYTLVKIQSQN